MTTMSPTLSNQIDRTWAAKLIPSLNQLLSDFEVLRFNVRAVMWNGWGEQYASLMDILPGYLSHAEEAVDCLARRVRCLEGQPPSTMDAMMAISTLKVHDGTMHHRGCTRMLSESLSHLMGHEREILTTAQHAGDEVTAHHITRLMEFQEEALWQLRASLRRTAFETEYLHSAGA